MKPNGDTTINMEKYPSAPPREFTGEPLVANVVASPQSLQQQISPEQFAAFQAWQQQQQQQQPQHRQHQDQTHYHHQRQDQQYKYQTQPQSTTWSQQLRYDADVSPTLAEDGNPKTGVLAVSHTLFWIGLFFFLMGPTMMFSIGESQPHPQRRKYGISGMVMEGLAILFHAPALFAMCFRGYPCFGATTVKSVLPGGLRVPGPGGLTGGKCSSRAMTLGSCIMFGISVLVFIGMLVTFSTSGDFQKPSSYSW